jgi:type IX secretion system PorP/SprF family membrane protein
MKRLIIFVALSLLSFGVFAQQDPMFTQYMFDKMLVNPGYVGSSNWIVATAKYRSQFMGIPGAPTTSTFTFHTPIQKKNIGVGLKFISDKTGVVTNNWFTLNGSYHVKLKEWKLSFGLEGGFINKSVDYSGLVRYDQNDGNIPSGENAFLPDVSFGTYLQNNKFYTGIAAYHLIPNTGTTGDARLNRHYFGFIGNVFDIVEKKFAFDPSILVKYVQAAPLQVDVNANFVYRDRFTVGAAWRQGDAFAVVLKADITEQIRVAYSYDVNTSGLSSFSNGGHEFLVSYGIKILPPPALKDIHPRYYF